MNGRKNLEIFSKNFLSLPTLSLPRHFRVANNPCLILGDSFLADKRNGPTTPCTVGGFILPYIKSFLSIKNKLRKNCYDPHRRADLSFKKLFRNLPACFENVFHQYEF